jgi:hypothetical protein
VGFSYPLPALIPQKQPVSYAYAYAYV